MLLDFIPKCHQNEKIHTKKKTIDGLHCIAFFFVNQAKKKKIHQIESESEQKKREKNLIINLHINYFDTTLKR